MRLYSTNKKSPDVNLRQAVLQGMPEDGGLYMPKRIPELPAKFIAKLMNLTFREISREITQAFFNGEIPESDLNDIVDEAINFDAPLVPITDTISTLELFHGPTLAFKDFGARFMARLMSYFIKDESRELTILVATSGDTGSAVAHGFYRVPGINVYVLYPSGKVSRTQEKQFTTLGENITALEIQGNFDDCQRLVKSAFTDPELNSSLWLTSANSINIARLIPQSFYYFRGFAQTDRTKNPIAVAVPSGNYGNLTAGLLAKNMGLPIEKFIAASNVNAVVPEYLTSGEFHPRPSIETISNAMDVGDPSNFARMLELYDHNVEKLRRDITGDSYTDEETRTAVQQVYRQYGYTLDPHGAVGFLALRKFLDSSSNISSGFFLETAHPAKFIENVRDLVDNSIQIPERLQTALEKPKQSAQLSNKFDEFKEYLFSV